jgi:hypothetical protein
MSQPKSLKDALFVLRKDLHHDYNKLIEGADKDEVAYLGIWEEEIAFLKQMIPSAKVDKIREGMEDFWRVNVTVLK